MQYYEGEGPGADLGGGALGAEAPLPSYFDLALGHREPGPSICFKSRLILIYSFTQH